ncbi:hypothetical protein Nepgr_001344 [Nepenthes gracilis]|uniref:Uncharacterized protein n=1 Tax=Nepenthes gracilis TaxID=150966 RepID=A0AAD3P2L0_NEPGR|nr:hypothetical protein Nepgr_001344 [Nepenthes gracilis]
MKRAAPHSDASMNPYIASQMQHVSAQAMQQNSRMTSFPGRPDAFPAEEERPYASMKAEGKWQWDRDAQQMSPTLYREGQGGNSSRSFYQSQIADPKLGSNQEPRVHPQEQDMEMGYEDNASPLTLEALEQKFRDDLMKLTKEQIDTEDAENARHREKILEINNQYAEQLSAIRARHADRREDFLRKESQARLQQYQLASVNHHQSNARASDIGGHHGFVGGAPPPGMVHGEAQRPYPGGQFDSYRQNPDSRFPTPGGRVYNTGPRRY